MLRGVFIKAKNNFPFLVVSITILTLLTLNFLLPIQEHESKAATPAEITKTSTVDWNKGEMTSVDGSSNELKISKSSGWVDENYLYREQLPVTAKTDNAIPKGFTLNSANVASGTFDGSGDWFDVGTNFNETLPVTIEAWVNLKSWNSHIFSSRETVTSNYNGFWMYVDGAGKVFLSYGDNTGQLSTSRRSKYGDTVIALDTWTHITGVIRGATDMSIYVNGVDANGAYSGTGGAMANAPTSSARIGWRNVAVNPMMKGNIDELRVWSKARSQAEILADMNKEITAQASLDAYYKFNQTTGSLVDDSGNSHTGTAGGNANYAPYSNVWGGVNTKALVDAGKMRSDGNDLRVYYGSVEIERELIPATGKTLATSEATQVLFKSQTTVASAQTDNNYYIYYGDSDATDPIVSVYNKMIRTRNAYITPYAGNGANYLQYNADNFPTNGDGTIELWFKYSNSEQHNYTTPLLSGEDTNNTWSWWYDRSGYRVVGKIGGNDIALVGANHNNGGEWNNLVITWHNTGSGSEIKTYENNVLTANKTDGTTITSWPNYIKLTDSVSTYDGVEVGKIGIYNTVKDATWVSTGYTSNAVAPITDGQRDSSATLLHNFDGDGFDATSINGGYASGTTAAISQGMVMSGDYRMGDTFDERAGNPWVSGVYNWYDNFDAINSKSPGWTEYGDINNVSNELRLAKNGQQLLMNRLSANTPTNYRIDVSAKGTQPEILFNHQGKIGWWGNNICSTNISGGGDGATDLGQPKDAATNFLTGATSKYYLGMYNGFIPKYIQFDLGTNGNYSSVVWEYWNGSVWTAFSPTTDGTANFSKSGIVDVSNISASYGANPAADGACGFNGNFNVIRVSAGTVTTPATIKQVNRIIDFAKLSYSATTNAISGDSHNASGSTTISRSTSTYKQIGLRRVGTGLQSFYDNYQSINTSTNSIFDTNFLGLSSTTDATYDDFKMYKALSDEPSLTAQSEVAKYPLGSGNTYLSPNSTTADSGILDAGWIGGWGTPNGFRANVTIPANTSIQFQIRSSAIGGANNNDWTAWADVGTATTSGAYDILTASMPNITLGLNRYLQLKAGLVTTDGSNTPVLSDYTVYYSGDGDAPTNPTISTVNVGGSSVSDGSWINFNGATNFNFSGSTDSESGVAGYYIYFGTDVNGVPATYQAHSGAIGDTQTYSTVIANSDDGKHYHFKIKALDIAGNSSEAVELYDFGYDNTAPLRPAFVSANPSGYTTQNSYAFTWPTATDPVGAGGSASGIKWYEYKTFADALWSHTANANVTTVSGIQAYQQGVNGFYVRTVDQVGNYSEDQQVTYYSSGDAPAKPSNLTVDPTTSDQNVFTISWDRPTVAQDKPAIKGYWYSINAAPTVNNVTFVSSAQEHIALTGLPFATIQGENTVYVLSEDQSGNKSYETSFVATQTFNCQTPAPPTPTAVSIYDSSDRAINRWMLTTQWLAGPNQDSESFNHYLIERSTDGLTYTSLATTTSNAYIDSENLDNNTLYYYRIKSVDNAAKESVASTIVSKQPTGSYLIPPKYEGIPTVTVKSASATITWYTDRDSSSFVKYGLDQDSLLESKGQFDKVKKHYVEITGLTPGKIYYYKVQSVDEDREYALDEAYSELYTLTTLSAPTISNVNISSISLSSAEISFETTTMSNSVIKYGLDTNYSSEIEDKSGQGTTLHKILLSSLVDGTRYHFKIFGVDVDGNTLTSDDYSFETLPMPVVSNLKVTPIADTSSFSVNVTWDTNVETTTLINYSKVGEASKEKVTAKLEKTHTIQLSGLVDQATYTLEATGRDQFGNLARSLSNTLPTPKDSRPPKLSDLRLESKIVGSGKDAKAQLIVSWKSDEPATSQLEYSVGSSSDQYDNKTTEDSFLTTDHLVIVSNLEVSRAYHLRAISKDGSLNSGVSEDSVIITKKAVQDAFSLIIDTLSQSLGFLGKLLKFGL